MESDDKRLLTRKWSWNPQGTVDYEAFVKIPDKQKVNKFTSSGTRLLVAKYPDFYKIYLLRYREEGEPCYPHCGVDVWIANEECKSCHYLDSVAIHPSKEVIKMRETRDSNDNVIGIQIGEYIPITKRDEREAKQLVNREKKMESEAKKQLKLEKKREKEKIKEERRMKKVRRMQEIEDRLKRKGSVKKDIEKKLGLDKKVKHKKLKLVKKGKHKKK